MFDDKYNKVASILIDAAPKEAIKVIYRATYIETDTVERIQYRWFDKDAKIDWFEGPDSDSEDTIDDAFYYIQNKMKQLTGNRWLMVEFTVSRDGTFDVRYGYDEADCEYE